MDFCNIVLKFGGTSLADSGQMKKVKSILEADEKRAIVIVSAPGKRFKRDEKITDLLFQAYELRYENGFTEVWEKIENRFKEIVSGLGIEYDIDEELESIRNTILSGGTYKHWIVSRGEFLNAKIMAKYLGYEFLDAREIIHFQHNGALAEEKTQAAINEKINPQRRYVIPGYYGSQLDGKRVAVFNRGGSDITGAVVAKFLGAAIYENWTDVPGICFGDPNKIGCATTVGKISFSEVMELTYRGAEVLNEEVIPYLLGTKVIVNVRNTNNPEHAGTFIMPDGRFKKVDASRPDIIAVAGKADFSVLRITKTFMNKEKGFARKVLEILEANDISFDHMPGSMNTLSVVIESAYLENVSEDIVREIKKVTLADKVEIEDGYAMIAVVGPGMNKPGSALKIFQVLADEDINVNIINGGASDVSLIVGVKEQDFVQSLKALHSQLA